MITPTQLFSIYKPLIGLLVLLLLILIVKVLIEKGIRTYFNNRKFKFQKQWLTERQILDALKSLKSSEFEEYIAHTYKILDTQQIKLVAVMMEELM